MKIYAKSTAEKSSYKKSKFQEALKWWQNINKQQSKKVV